MSEETPLWTFEGWSLIDFAWNPSSGLMVTVQHDPRTESPDESTVRQIAFRPVLFLKTVTSENVSKASEMADNEIYKFEEIKDSWLVSSLREKDNFSYLTCSFGNDYEGSMTVSSPGRPCFPRHFVLLSDYVDLEVLCAGYTITPADPKIRQGAKAETGAL